MRDKYDRLLAYVWFEDETEVLRMLNLMLLRAGLAEILIIDTNDEHEETFRREKL